ncbi:hypothetical protein GCM10011369_08590 [Neiella marina]|uniref:GGDEF domain-containing protein n=1 Tax=Neiella marina TaxID=508461 RepID=A0A8J2XN56_9GAMM|nr:GGDEF domain-containing phosphodiesterase [Neiella marina]GGA69223.1 hypothetical protein GCM10011369_08590 [Neiella marina]
MIVSSQRLNLKANLIYGFVLAIGLGLSAYVYLSVDSLKQISSRLVSNQLPVLQTSSSINHLLGEHERLLYEYYATVDSALYTEHAQAVAEQLSQALSTLAMYAGDNRVEPVKLHLAKIDNIAAQLHQNLRKRSVDWDLARAQLRQLSDERRDILPLLSQLESTITGEVNQGYQQTQNALAEMFAAVVVYGAAVLLLAILLGRYVKRYLLLSDSNARLALFAERNPNPVLSLGERGDVLYQNPASSEVLKQFNGVDNPTALLSPDLGQQLFDARNHVSDAHRHEHQLEDRYFSYEIHWLADMAAFDIHIKDISQKKRAQLQLMDRAYRNDQSGLFNRLRFNEDINNAIIKGQSISLVLVEVAQMGQLQGHYGLNGASACIEGVTHTLIEQFETAQQRQPLNATLYHIADGSFAILAQHLTADSELQFLVKQIASRFQTPVPTTLGQMRIQVQLGITEHAPQVRTGHDLLLDAKIAADQALQKGGDTISYFDIDVGQAHARRAELALKLEQAIEKNQLSLYMQPQMAMPSRTLIGAEALLRWHCDGEFISLAEFIPVAEQTGLILAIGDWVLEQACLMTAEYRRLGLVDLVVAINISPRQFLQSDFTARVEQLLNQYQVPPSAIELEITESTIMDNEQTGILVLNQLKSLGVSLAIDDFGTGYSSLAYLKQFPVDKLKIDRSFVRNIEHNLDDQAIVLSLCQMAKNLKLSVLAEGIETEPQLDILAQYDCDAIQGYWFSRPLKHEDFVRFSEKMCVSEPLVD